MNTLEVKHITLKFIAISFSDFYSSGRSLCKALNQEEADHRSKASITVYFPFGRSLNTWHEIGRYKSPNIWHVFPAVGLCEMPRVRRDRQPINPRNYLYLLFATPCHTAAPYHPPQKRLTPVEVSRLTTCVSMPKSASRILEFSDSRKTNACRNFGMVRKNAQPLSPKNTVSASITRSRKPSWANSIVLNMPTIVGF